MTFWLLLTFCDSVSEFCTNSLMKFQLVFPNSSWLVQAGVIITFNYECFWLFHLLFEVRNSKVIFWKNNETNLQSIIHPRWNRLRNELLETIVTKVTKVLPKNHRFLGYLERQHNLRYKTFKQRDLRVQRDLFIVKRFLLFRKMNLLNSRALMNSSSKLYMIAQMRSQICRCSSHSIQEDRSKERF